MDMSLKNKLRLLTGLALIPMTILLMFLMVSTLQYGDRYNRIVRNISAANYYTITFKKDIDYAMYRIAIGSVDPDRLDEEGNLIDPYGTMRNPYMVIDDTEKSFRKLYDITTVDSNKGRINRLLISLQNLRKYVDEIIEESREGGHYDENMYKLDTNIRLATEVIQSQIQEYVYYETANLDVLRQKVSDELRNTLNISIIAFALVLLTSWSVANIISRSISFPLKQLCETTKLVAEGDFTTRASDSSGDEVKMLTDSFNSMIEKIGRLMEDVKTEQKNLRATELRLLQAQINPHFLYNTLDTIVWLVEGGQKEQAVEMVTTLSDFFRTTLSKGRDDITLFEEQLHVESYLKIQQFRYRDIMEYDVDIPKELHQYRILKLTLQPLVENALYHGIKEKRGKGKITVDARQFGQTLVLSVCDNGIGMDGERLAHVRSIVEGAKAQSKDVGFGLFNVNQRIRLNYGKNYGLTIDSKYGEGSVFTVTIPVVI